MSLAVVYKATSREKTKWDPWLTKYFYRPIAMPLTALILPSKITPDQITFCGVLLLYLSAGMAVFLPKVISVFVMVLGMGIFAISDVVDGALARARSVSSQLGAWVDAIGGYAGLAGFHICWIIVLVQSKASSYLILLVVVALAMNLLLRLIYAKSTEFLGVIGKESNNTDDGFINSASRLRRVFYQVTSNLGVTGFFLPVVAASIIIPAALVFAVVYASLYFGCFFGAALYFYKKLGMMDVSKLASDEN